MLGKREEYIVALLEEIQQRKDYLPTKHIDTIYFGGGTPSLLKADDINKILQQIRDKFEVAADAEITLEGNPGDLTIEYLRQLKSVGINRLSIGIQSFNDELLRTIGRRHNAQQAQEAVVNAKECGFRNISIDLIYGLPEQDIEEWRWEIECALALDIQHISTYCLTYEEGTELTLMKDKGEVRIVDDDTENEMYSILANLLKESGFYRYEVSNFAKLGYSSRHNSAYWNNIPYLGIGAGAHSYNGDSRQWNIADLNGYIGGLRSGTMRIETEYLTETDKYNECVMLSLRTSEGIDTEKLTEEQRSYCLRQAQPFLEQNLLYKNDTHIIATTQGINILNIITENLMK